MIFLYWWLVSRQALLLIRHVDIARLFVLSIFFLILLLLSSVSFFFGQYFYRYIFTFEQFSPHLIKFILLVLMWALFLLSGISFIITFIQNFLRKDTMLFLLSSRNIVSIASALFSSTAVAGSWPYMIISFPFFLSLILQRNASFSDCLLLLLSLILLSIITAAISGIGVLLFFLLAGKHVRRLLPGIALGGLVLLFYIFTHIIYPYDLSQISQYSSMEEVVLSLQQLPIASYFLPPVLFVEGILHQKEALIFLMAETMIVLLIFYQLAHISFKRVWQMQYEGYYMPQTKLFVFKKNLFRFYTVFPHSFFMTFIQKEILSFVRTPGSYMYMGFILFLIAVFIYFVDLSVELKSDYMRLSPFLVVAIVFSLSYIFLLIAIKYIFPTFVQESLFIWSFITVGKSRKLMVSSKWIFYIAAAVLFILPLSFMVLQSYIVLSIFDMVVLFGGSTLVVASVALYVGLIFHKQLPKTNSDDISTSTAGILVTLVALGIGGAMAWATVAQKIYYFSSVFILFAAVSICLILLLLSLGFVKRNDM